MAEKALVEKVKEAVGKLDPEPASMFMLVSSGASELDKFTLLISAPWLDKKSPKQAIETIFSTLKSTLNSTEFRSISRITPIKTTDRFVLDARHTWKLNSPTQHYLDIVNGSISGMHIDRGTLVVPQGGIAGHQAEE